MFICFFKVAICYQWEYVHSSKLSQLFPFGWRKRKGFCDGKQEDEIVSHLFLIPQDKGFGDFPNFKFFKTVSKTCFVESIFLKVLIYYCP